MMSPIEYTSLEIPETHRHYEDRNRQIAREWQDGGYEFFVDMTITDSVHDAILSSENGYSPLEIWRDAHGAHKHVMWVNYSGLLSSTQAIYRFAFKTRDAAMMARLSWRW